MTLKLGLRRVSFQVVFCFKQWQDRDVWKPQVQPSLVKARLPLLFSPFGDEKEAVARTRRWRRLSGQRDHLQSSGGQPEAA